MTKLYELSDELRTIQMLLEQGIDDAELYSRLERIEDGIESRLLGLAALVKEHELDAAAAKQEAERLANRADKFARDADRLREWMLRYMESTRIDKPIKGTRFTLALRSCPPSVRVINERDVQPEFSRTIPERKEINKQALIDLYLRTGEIAEGIDVVTDKKTLSIR